MRKIFKARVFWVSREQGGRQSLPTGDIYGPKIKVISPTMIDNTSAWSLIVQNKEIISELETIAEVWYLSDKAPDNLFKGVEFELFEGKKLVAKGIIL